MTNQQEKNKKKSSKTGKSRGLFLLLKKKITTQQAAHLAQQKRNAPGARLRLPLQARKLRVLHHSHRQPLGSSSMLQERCIPRHSLQSTALWRRRLHGLIVQLEQL